METKIVDINYGRTDEFEVVTEWPWGYVLWNIGRENFQHPGYIPLAKPTTESQYYIRLDRLKALYLGDEELCLRIIKEGHKHWVDKDRFNEIMKEYHG